MQGKARIIPAKAIEGRVAQVLNARELLINVGYNDGVMEGMRFSVLANEPLQVIDPDTKENLGVLDREKVRVTVSDVNDRFSVCSTYRTTPGLLQPFAMPAIIGTTETLAAKDSSLPTELSEEESYVKIGDRVKEILKERPSHVDLENS